MKRIPKRWRDYLPVGENISGTKIIPFKVPLKPEICKGLSKEEWFTPTILLQKQPRLKAIIDLTDTNRYYDPQEFQSRGVTHIKINVTGHGKLPSFSKIRRFYEAVDAFMEKYANDPDALIGVHCTHGLNRTGYLICNYMVDKLQMTPSDAIQKFETARGHSIERKVYVNHIKMSDRPLTIENLSLREGESESVVPSLKKKYNRPTRERDYFNTMGSDYRKSRYSHKNTPGSSKYNTGYKNDERNNFQKFSSNEGITKYQHFPKTTQKAGSRKNGRSQTYNQELEASNSACKSGKSWRHRSNSYQSSAPSSRNWRERP